MNFETEQYLEEVYFKASEISRGNNQVVGEKNDNYITLEQLTNILMSFKVK